MISVTEAQQRIISCFNTPAAVLIPIETALGYCLSGPVRSNITLPPFDNSSVDGFAICSSDTTSDQVDGEAKLLVTADIPAGSTEKITITRGQAARIMTGAPIPLGADAVVMIEDTDSNQNPVGSSAPKHVKVLKSILPGENIRRRGSDINPGQEILPAGAVLRPQDIGILAMLGIPAVNVIRKPRVAIISSGDELIPVGSPLESGKIYDSNSYMLSAMVQHAGAEVIFKGTAEDRLDAVQIMLQQAVASKPDIIISSAGVSVGAFDYVKSAVESAGSLSFWKVNMRPGKPLAFGSYREIPFFGLPGNPVSSFVSFLIFVQPVLQLLSGIKTNQIRKEKVTLDEQIDSDGRESYLRAQIRHENGHIKAKLTGHQGSGNLFSLVQANALLIIPSGVKSCPPGSEVDAWILEY